MGDNFEWIFVAPKNINLPKCSVKKTLWVRPEVTSIVEILSQITPIHFLTILKIGLIVGMSTRPLSCLSLTLSLSLSLSLSHSLSFSSSSSCLFIFHSFSISLILLSVNLSLTHFLLSLSLSLSPNLFLFTLLSLFYHWNYARCKSSEKNVEHKFKKYGEKMKSGKNEDKWVFLCNFWIEK
jgi:hypothetical protein